MITKICEEFKKGLVTKILANSIPRGAAASSLNWLTNGDRITLARGFEIIGDDAGSGKVTGLFTFRGVTGTEITFRTRGKKIEYYNTSTLLWVEIGTDQLGTAADGEDVSMGQYNSNAGNQGWICSPNSSLYKFLVANPTNLVDQYDSTKNFKGLMSLILNRMWLWKRKQDKTGVYGSYIDAQSYTTVTAEAIAGSGTGRSGTLAFKAGDAKRTCFNVTFTDGTETFVDNYDGTLTGSAGGTGTINYATGAYVVTFAASAVTVTSTYQWENSTSNGIADFTKSGTRTAGQGFIFRQDNGKGVQNILSYNNQQYCLHRDVTYRIEIGVDDTQATNRVWRSNVGIPNYRAAVATGEGIYYVDDTNIGQPQFRLLTIDENAIEVIPVSKSLDLNLSGYVFDKCAAIEFNDYVLFACREDGVSENNRVFVFNKVWKTWDILDYFVSCFAINNGELWAGDSVTNNVYKLFSGLSADDAIINNYWIGKSDDLDIYQLKKNKRFVISGLIGTDQIIEVYANIDNSGFVLIGTIYGTGDYVDTSDAVTVGSSTVGSEIVGGGSNGIVAYEFLHELPVALGQFKEIQVKYVATGVGWAEISRHDYKDIRVKSNRIPNKYR